MIYDIILIGLCLHAIAWLYHEARKSFFWTAVLTFILAGLAHLYLLLGFGRIHALAVGLMAWYSITSIPATLQGLKKKVTGAGTKG